MPIRTEKENDAMLQLCLSSLWHWTQREDCTSTNLSIGYWQVSRVYALMRQVDNARYYGERCLEASLAEGVEAYYRGVAFEALARAEAVAGNQDRMENYLLQAHLIADTLADPEEKKMLLSDLATIKFGLGNHAVIP
jgi:hypothetical protein